MFAGFILKRQTLDDKIGHIALCCSILSVNKIYEQMTFELTPSKPYW